MTPLYVQYRRSESNGIYSYLESAGQLKLSLTSTTSMVVTTQYFTPPAAQLIDLDVSIGVSAFCDWILNILPMAFLWNVQMRLRVKIGICLLIGLGYL